MVLERNTDTAGNSNLSGPGVGIPKFAVALHLARMSVPVRVLREDLHLARAAVTAAMAPVTEMIAATILGAVHTNIGRGLAAD